MQAFLHANSIKRQEGQVLLIVVLTMVVALTVGLGIVSRSIVQVKTAKDQGDSQKAFSAAEAGVEQALKNNVHITGEPLGNHSTVSNVTVSSSTSPKLVLNNGTQLFQDEGTDVWLAPYQNYAVSSSWSGKVQIFWGTSNNGCNNAAMEVILISEPSAGNFTMQHYAFDPCSSRAGSNNFTVANPPTPPGTVNGTQFYFTAPVTIANGIVARIIPLYTNTTIGIIGYDNSGNYQSFPAQGTVITSTGTSGATQREIIYFQGYPQLPSQLFYSLFSPQ